ncbi:MAG TPA: hypothetical protein PKM65_12870 [Spirochaetota bacterium]|nr:hypothetical protein [Spirochaetota bacterium]HNT10956.1 hypothetical protein [Spirochaetota bacterium]
MADVKLNPVFEGFRRKIGDLVFFNRNGELFVRRKGTQRNPKTSEQMEVRNAFTQLVNNWKGIGGILQRGWGNAAKGSDKTGYNLFIGANAKRQRSGEVLELFKPVGDDTLFEFVAAPGTEPGSISVSFAPVNGGHHVTLFTQKKTNGAASGMFSRHDSGENPAGPVVLSGLEPAAEYFVYGVITDAAYPAATRVTRSHGALCVSA